MPNTKFKRDPLKKSFFPGDFEGAISIKIVKETSLRLLFLSNFVSEGLGGTSPDMSSTSWMLVNLVLCSPMCSFSCVLVEDSRKETKRPDVRNMPHLISEF